MQFRVTSVAPQRERRGPAGDQRARGPRPARRLREAAPGTDCLRPAGAPWLFYRIITSGHMGILMWARRVDIDVSTSLLQQGQKR